MPQTQWVPSAYCPMGCGPTVHRNPGTGNLLCLHEACPRPYAVMDILGESEQEHLVLFTDQGHFYNIRHPLRERLDHHLLECEVAWGLVSILDSGFAPEPGRIYRLMPVANNADGEPEYRLEPTR
jgi:Family of unknown function (DUF6085)